MQNKNVGYSCWTTPWNVEWHQHDFFITTKRSKQKPKIGTREIKDVLHLPKKGYLFTLTLTTIWSRPLNSSDHVYYRWPRSIYRPLCRPLYRSTVDRLSGANRSTVDRQSTDCRSRVGRLSTDTAQKCIESVLAKYSLQKNRHLDRRHLDTKRLSPTSKLW